MTDDVRPEILTSPRKKGPDSQTKRAHQNRLKKMEKYFAEMPKETVRIRPDDGNQWVQINGYAFSIMATGEPVEVPTQVADMLRAKGVA